MSGVLASSDAIIKPVDEPFLDRPIQLSELALGKIADFNRPGQDLSLHLRVFFVLHRQRVPAEPVPDLRCLPNSE